jgi:hypothetical protein
MGRARVVTLGMAVLGSSCGYRTGLDLPAGLTPAAGHAAHDSIGAALRTAGTLPVRLGSQVVEAAGHAFMTGMHLAVFCSAGLAALTGLAALFALRRVPKVIPDHAAERADDGRLTPA